MSFMLDETASRVTRQDINLLSPPKALGSRHNPLPHKQLIDLMEAGLIKNKFKINGLELGLTHDGNRIFGLFDVEAPSSEIMLKKHNSNYEVGFRGYDPTVLKAPYPHSVPRVSLNKKSLLTEGAFLRRKILGF